MKKAKNVFLSLCFLSAFLFLIPFNFADAEDSSQESSPPSWWSSQLGMEQVADVYGEEKNPIDVRLQAARIINIVLSVLAILLVVMIIYAGITWMTAAGNEDSVKKAKKILSNSIIGLVIVILSWSITTLIIRQLEAVTTGIPYYPPPSHELYIPIVH